MSDSTAHAVAAPQAAASTSLAAVLRLQRKCACGGGKCASCEQKKKKGLQAKLEVGASDDHLEREADRAAEQVMHGGHADAGPVAPMQLRRVGGGTGGLGEAPAEVQQVLSSPGVALDAGARSFFESRFGHDFSRVRVHHDAPADASARAVGARAYTVGSSVVFASGQYAPHSHGGRQLMAHELAHVVQQGQASARLQRAPAPPPKENEIRPPKGSRWRVLSKEEIQADDQRRVAMKNIDEKEARYFPSSMKGGKPKGAAVLKAGTVVMVDEVVHPETVSPTDRKVTPYGSGMYQVNWPGGSGFVYSVVLAEAAAEAAQPATKPKAEEKLNYVELLSQAARKEPPELRLVSEAIATQTPISPDELVKALKKKNHLMQGRIEEVTQKFLVYRNGVDPKFDFFKEMTRDLRQDTQLPELTLQFNFLDVLDGRTVGIGMAMPKELAREVAEVRSPSLKVKFIQLYIDSNGNALGLAAEDEATNALLVRIDAQLQKLEPRWRREFDKENKNALSSWEELADKVDRKVLKQADDKELEAKSHKPKQLTGSKLDDVVGKHKGTSAEAASPELQKLRSEQERRDLRVKTWKTIADQQAAPMRGKDTQSRLNALSPDQQLQMMGKVFGLGFIAGIEYELPEGSKGNLAGALTGEELPKFQMGVYKGLIPGAAAGVLEALAGLLELAGMVGAFGIDVATDLAKDLYEPVLDGDAYLERKRKQSVTQKKYLDAFLTGARQFVEAFEQDPGFLADVAFPIGQHAGKGAAAILDEELTGPNLSSDDRGYFVGKVIGRVIIEILMAVVAPEELALQAAARAGVLKGAKIFTAVEQAATKIDALEPLIKARRVVDEANDARRMASGGAHMADDVKNAGTKIDKVVPETGVGKATGKVDDVPAPKAGEAPRPKADADADADADAAPQTRPQGEGFFKQAGRDEFGHAHAVQVKPDRQICLCSDCKRMAELLKPDLDKGLTNRLATAEKVTDPAKAADEGIEVFQAVVKKRKKKMQAKKPKAAAPAKKQKGFQDLDEHGPANEPQVFGKEDQRALPSSKERNALGRDADADEARDVLRENLGETPERGAWQAHHIVPWELRNHPAVYEYERLIAKIDNPTAATAARTMNSAPSGIRLPKSDKVKGADGMVAHRGSHKQYTQEVAGRLDELWYEYTYGKRDLESFGKRYEAIVGEFEDRLRAGTIGKAEGDGRVLR